MKTIKIVTLLTLILMSITSCYKLKSSKKVKVNVKVINPISGVGSPNVKWQILESKKTMKVLSSDSHVFMEGFTDQNGEAYIEFKKPIGNKWLYGIRLAVTSQTTYWNIDNDKVYDITAYKSENTSFFLHVKNTNCFDANDLFNIKFKNGIYTTYNFTSFSSGYDYNGCSDEYTKITTVEDYYPITKTLTRNGVTTTTYDTLVVSKAMEGDTINILY